MLASIPQSGRILINDHPMSDYDIDEYVSSFPSYFRTLSSSLTLRDNVALSNVAGIDDDEEIIEALKLGGIYEEYSKFSNGLDTDVTRRFADDGVELSKGNGRKSPCRALILKRADYNP